MYASARASLAAGREKVPQGLAGLLPTVGLSGAVSRNNTEVFAVQRRPGDHQSADRRAKHRRQQWRHRQLEPGDHCRWSQPLFRWDRWETYEQSKLVQAITEAQFAQAQQDLITRVSQAYFDVLAAQDTLESTRAQKTATTEQLASAKRNFEVGTQTITDTHEAQAAYDLVVAQEFAAINDLENKKSALQAIIGTAPTALATLKPGVTLAPPQPAIIDPWVSSAETQNYGVTVSQLSLESAKRDIKRNRAGHYPTADLVATSQRQKVGGSTASSATHHQQRHRPSSGASRFSAVSPSPAACANRSRWKTRREMTWKAPSAMPPWRPANPSWA